MHNAETANDYYDKAELWGAELAKLRKAVLALPLEETVKWGAPVYVFEGNNVVGIVAFKNWVALWFYQGALLDDPQAVLINAQAGRTKAMRQWRFSHEKQMNVAQIKSYVRAAIELARQGKAIKAQRDKPLEVPFELSNALARHTRARVNFEAMSKSCRREYAEYIAEAKRDETKQRRLEKILPMIAAKTGLNDKYK